AWAACGRPPSHRSRRSPPSPGPLRHRWRDRQYNRPRGTPSQGIRRTRGRLRRSTGASVGQAWSNESDLPEDGAADSLVQGKLAPPDRPKKRAVKLGDFTALRPFRRRGAFSTGRKGRERTLARPRERVVGGGATDAGDTLHLVSPQP